MDKLHNVSCWYQECVLTNKTNVIRFIVITIPLRAINFINLITTALNTHTHTYTHTHTHTHTHTQLYILYFMCVHSSKQILHLMQYTTT